MSSGIFARRRRTGKTIKPKIETSYNETFNVGDTKLAGL